MRPVSFFRQRDDSEKLIIRRVSKLCAALPARTSVAFDHNIRSASGKKSKKRIVGGQEVQRPAHVVHGDYTLTSAPERLRQLAGAPKSNDTYRPLLGDGETLLDADHVEQAIASGRFAIINLWRNIVAEPVELNPLALCDAATVKPEDLVVFEIHYTGPSAKTASPSMINAIGGLLP